MLISYVIPCYRSEQTIGGVVADIKKTITENTDYSYEVILVNDCSPDGVYSVLQQLAAEDVECVILKSRSPTCGVKQVHDGTFTGTLVDGMGVLAKALSEAGYRVIDAEEL